MLVAGVLLTELQRHADPRAPVFAGWSTHREAARRRWAQALATYLGGLQDAQPVLSPSGVTLGFVSVEEAVFSALSFTGSSRAAAAEDLARAWRAGILAIESGASATDPATSAVFTFAGMDPASVDARFAALRGALIDAYRSQSAVRAVELQQIVAAIHAAAVGIPSTASPLVVIYK
jgi:hypothetical protein